VLVVPSRGYKLSINSFSNLNPVYGHTLNRDNTTNFVLKCLYITETNLQLSKVKLLN
jgi:hypothetical protein